METIRAWTVYLITCIPNGKKYVGISCDPKKRWRQHRNWAAYLNKPYRNNGCPALQRAIAKHGWENFKTEILRITLCLEKALMLEMSNISELDTLSPKGYNLNSGGIPPSGIRLRGRKRSEEFKDKVAQEWRDPEKRERRIRLMTQALNESDVRKAISNTAKAAWSDPQIRAKRLAGIKRGWKKRERKPLNPDALERIRAASRASALARWANPEFRDKELARRRLQ